MERNFQEAKTSCEVMNANLVMIKSQQDQDFLTTLLGQQEMKDTVWIGLYKEHNEFSSYDLKWVDNSTASYLNFQPNQPDSDRREACIHMLAREVTAGKWNDIMCSVNLGFLCQFQLVDSSPSKDGMDVDSRCPPGSKFYLGTCYKLEEGEEDWFKAEEQCHSRYGGHLVSMLDMHEQAFVGLLTAKVDTEIWIGFSDTNKSTEGTLRWSDNRPVYHTNWQGKEPSDDNFGQRCIAMQKKKKWKVRNCNEKRRFVCALHLVNEKANPIVTEPVSGSCPEDFIDVGNKYCYFISQTFLPFTTAKRECRDMGDNGTLAIFQSEHDLSLFRRHLSRHTWYGLAVGIQETSYKFYSYVTDPDEKASYLPWKPGQPDNPDTEKCVELLVSIMQYNNYPCGWGKLFICQIDKLIPPKMSAQVLEQGGLSGGGVAGIVMVVLLLISASAVTGFYFYRKRSLDNQVKDGVIKFHNEKLGNSSQI